MSFFAYKREIKSEQEFKDLLAEYESQHKPSDKRKFIDKSLKQINEYERKKYIGHFNDFVFEYDKNIELKVGLIIANAHNKDKAYEIYKSILNVRKLDEEIYKNTQQSEDSVRTEPIIQENHLKEIYQFIIENETMTKELEREFEKMKNEKKIYDDLIKYKNVPKLQEYTYEIVLNGSSNIDFNSDRFRYNYPKICQEMEQKMRKTKNNKDQNKGMEI